VHNPACIKAYRACAASHAGERVCGRFRIHWLLGRINRCGVIKPRFSVKASKLEDWEKRFLPGKDFGMLVITTPKGVLSHSDARKLNTGGKLLAYVY
jgi:small subunit ribosomal protein S8